MVDFAVMIIEVSETFAKSNAGVYLSDQMMRAAVSSALNYAEGQSGESRKDFIHKLKISLKELRETFVCLQIAAKTKFNREPEKVAIAHKECNELISIIVKSIATAVENDRKEKEKLRQKNA